MIVVRKFFMSILWFVIFLVIVVIGLTIYIVMGLDLSDQDAATAAAETIGAEIGQKYGNLIVFGLLAVSVLGSIFGILPGSRHNRTGEGGSGVGGMVIRKFLASILWFVILYLLVAFVGGGIVGGMAGANDPDNAVAAGAAAGEAFGAQYGSWMILGSFAVAVLGSITGVLPFSKHNKD